MAPRGLRPGHRRAARAVPRPRALRVDQRPHVRGARQARRRAGASGRREARHGQPHAGLAELPRHRQPQRAADDRRAGRAHARRGHPPRARGLRHRHGRPGPPAVGQGRARAAAVREPAPRRAQHRAGHRRRSRVPRRRAAGGHGLGGRRHRRLPAADERDRRLHGRPRAHRPRGQPLPALRRTGTGHQRAARRARRAARRPWPGAARRPSRRRVPCWASRRHDPARPPLHADAGRPRLRSAGRRRGHVPPAVHHPAARAGRRGGVAPGVGGRGGPQLGPAQQLRRGRRGGPDAAGRGRGRGAARGPGLDRPRRRRPGGALRRAAAGRPRHRLRPHHPTLDAARAVPARPDRVAAGVELPPRDHRRPLAGADPARAVRRLRGARRDRGPPRARRLRRLRALDQRARRRRRGAGVLGARAPPRLSNALAAPARPARGARGPLAAAVPPALRCAACARRGPRSHAGDGAAGRVRAGARTGDRADRPRLRDHARGPALGSDADRRDRGDAHGHHARARADRPGAGARRLARRPAGLLAVPCAPTSTCRWPRSSTSAASPPPSRSCAPCSCTRTRPWPRSSGATSTCSSA